MKLEYIFYNKHDNSFSKVKSISSGSLILEGGKYGYHSAMITDGVLILSHENLGDKKRQDIYKNNIENLHSLIINKK